MGNRGFEAVERRWKGLLAYDARPEMPWNQGLKPKKSQPQSRIKIRVVMWQRDMKIQQKHRSSQRVPVFLARLARFERAALRLGVLKKVLCQSSSEFVKALFFNAGSSQSVFWRSSEIACFCLKIPSKIRWRLDDLRKLLGPFRHLTHFLDNRNLKSKWFGTQPQLTAIEADQCCQHSFVSFRIYSIDNCMLLARKQFCLLSEEPLVRWNQLFRHAFC